MIGGNGVRFLTRRVAFGLFAVFALASLALVLARNAAGGPAVALLGEHAAAGEVEEIASRLGLDRPAVEVWLAWLARLAAGDLGWFWREQAPVASLILERLPLTPLLMGTAASLALGAGTAIGVALSAYPRRWPAGVLAALHAVPPYSLAHPRCSSSRSASACSQWLDCKTLARPPRAGSP